MYLKRFIHEDGHFKAYILDTTQVGQAVFQGLQPSPIALQLLTQAMTGALMLTANLKGDGIQQFKFKGDGPMEHITVESNTYGHVRGFTGNLNLILERDTDQGLFQQAIGAGNLHVVRRTEKAPKPFESITQLNDGEIAINLARYLLDSEQIQAGIQIGADLDPDLGVKGAGGILLQALPKADENVLFIMEDRLATMKPLGELMAMEKGIEEIMDHLFYQMPVKLLGEQAVTYRCSCSHQRILQVIASLPNHEIESMLSEKRTFEINCSFCQKGWPCSPEDLEIILKHKQGQS